MTRSLGTIQSPLLLFGGVYSNLHALEALKKVADAHQIPADQIICTGDIVGYCAYPEECIQIIQSWGIHVIAGNVEINLRDQADDCGCNFNEGGQCDLFSRQWFPFAQRRLSDDSFQFLLSLPLFLKFDFEGKSCFVLHGSYVNTSEFIFKSTPWEVKNKNFISTGADLIIAGHCGLPFMDKHQNQSWLNPGVIGMPANDGTPDTWYAILREEGLQFYRLEYDAVAARKDMLSHPLPKTYAVTLVTGIWDNCEILPAQETGTQGKQIIFPPVVLI